MSTHSLTPDKSTYQQQQQQEPPPHNRDRTKIHRCILSEPLTLPPSTLNKHALTCFYFFLLVCSSGPHPRPKQNGFNHFGAFINPVWRHNCHQNRLRPGAGGSWRQNYRHLLLRPLVWSMPWVYPTIGAILQRH